MNSNESINKLLRKTLSKIEQDYGVAITELRAEWTESPTSQKIRHHVLPGIQIEALIGDRRDD